VLGNLTFFMLRNLSILSLLALVCVCSVAVNGCGSKSPKRVKTLPPEEVAPTMQAAFKGASAEATAAANEALTALQNNDAPRALEELMTLKDRQDLSAEQQTATAQSTLSVLARLQAEAASGKKEAEEVLARYRATR
jgi:hypothetical protein